MIVFRSVVFAGVFYGWSAIMALAMVPLLLAPGRWMSGAMKIWAQGVIVLLRSTCDIRVEFRGLNNIPSGPLLIASKHQCMFDTMGPLVVIDEACYVMKRELTWIPFYSWFSAKTKMIVVDRDGQAAALRGLLSKAKERVAEGRQILIFPEGSRTPPGITVAYQPGVAGLYRTLSLPCVPLATNSGVHWPAHGFLRKPGTIVFEFLAPIAPGLPRVAFMAELTQQVETASRRLLSE